jgi:hypothetical protein
VWLSEALREAREQGDRLAELRVGRDLARLWTEQGERQKACDLLAPICGWLTDRGELRDLTEARALLICRNRSRADHSSCECALNDANPAPDLLGDLNYAGDLKPCPGRR